MPSRPRFLAIIVVLCSLFANCATVTPQYVVRPTPVPEESAWATQLERTISAYQARDLERKGARPLGAGERLSGFDIQQLVDNLSRVTERAWLHYRAILLYDEEPNAAALADGRIYVTQGMLKYLASRGSNVNEFAFVLGHELAHTVAQHLVKRYQQMQQQQMIMDLVGLGTAAITKGRGPQAQEAAKIARNVASVVTDVVTSGYSQDQELEADQLGIRYVIRAGYDPRSALAMLEDFKRFDRPGTFLRTHPYTERRKQDLERYLIDTGSLKPGDASIAAPSRPLAPSRLAPLSPMHAPARLGPAATRNGALDEARRRLLEAQRFYPIGSQSWLNIQKQLDALK